MKNLTCFTYLILFLSCFLLVACKSTSLKIGNLDVGQLVGQGVKVFNAHNIDEEQEIQFGENMSAVLLGVRPLYENKDINITILLPPNSNSVVVVST